MVSLFNLEGARTYELAESTIMKVNAKLRNMVQLDGLEVVCWSKKHQVICFHGITRLTNKSVLLTVQQDGTVYADMEGRDDAIKLGKLF